VLTAATAGGYASLGLAGGGTIAPGALADVTTIALDSVRLAGTPPLDGTVFCATAADVRDVMVGGRWVVRGGAHVSIDVARELREVLAP
jgi:cytosine/adenosine deaminase-related metal-dependent hydrolase